MTDVATLREALSLLDPEKSEHWTSGGQPRLDVLTGILGEAIDRRTLNELVPGFSRGTAQSSRPAVAAPDPAAPEPQSDRTHAQKCHQRLMDRAARRQAAIAYLVAGGFYLKDLEPVRSRLDQRMAATNRAARREIGN